MAYKKAELTALQVNWVRYVASVVSWPFPHSRVEVVNADIEPYVTTEQGKYVLYIPWDLIQSPNLLGSLEELQVVLDSVNDYLKIQQPFGPSDGLNVEAIVAHYAENVM